MAVSKGLLERLGASQVSNAIINFFAMIMGAFNMLFKPVEAFVKLIV